MINKFTIAGLLVTILLSGCSSTDKVDAVTGAAPTVNENDISSELNVETNNNSEEQLVAE